jgi:exonuclease SbcD
MRLLHTSDWHLGRSLSNQTMHADQVRFVDWFVEVVRQQQVELVIVAGDLFDRAVPPTEAVVLWRSALTRIRQAGARVVAIAGNHDGADRVAAHDGLTDLAGIFIRGGYDRAGELITIDASDGPVHIAAVPYLDPVLKPAVAGDGDDAVKPTHETVLAEALAEARAAAASNRLVAVAHAFVSGGAESSSERHLTVGGTGQVPVSVFDGFSYVALGHLHRPQGFAAAPHVRYSGTPLAYSFSEDHRKEVVLVDLAPDGSATHTYIPVPDSVCRPVATITGTMEQLLGDPSLASLVDHYVRAIITDREFVVDARSKLAARYPYIREIEPRPEGGPATSISVDRGEGRSRRSPLDNARSFWADITGEPATEAEESVMAAALQAVAVAEVTR